MRNREIPLSYVIPAYNVEHVLESCVKSIIQISDNIEIIIVNDGSIDGTSDVAKDLSEKYPEQIKVIEQENCGVSTTRNIGIRFAHGKYIAFSDADDTVNTEEVRKIIVGDEMTEDIIMFNYTTVENGKRKVQHLFPDLMLDNCKEALLNHLLYCRFSQNDDDLVMGGKVFQYFWKKEFLDSNKIWFDTTLPYAEDLVFCCLAVNKATSIKVVNKSIYNYFIIEGTASRCYRENYWHELQNVYNALNQICPKNINKGMYYFYARIALLHIAEYAKSESVSKNIALAKFREVLSDERVHNDFITIKNHKWTLKEKIINFLMNKSDKGKSLYYYFYLSKSAKYIINRFKFRGGQIGNQIQNRYKRIRLSRLEYERYIMRKSGVVFGENVCIYDSYIDPAFGYLITIGNNVTITNSKLYAHDASLHVFLGKSKVGKIRIGSNVFIGANSVIMPNITIGDNVIIGAGTIVCKDVPDNSIVGGNPAKKIENTSQFVNKHAMAMRVHPVWNVYWQYKSDEDKETMRTLLENGWGYDE